MFRRFKNPYLTQKWPKEKFEFSANQSSVFNFRISMTSTFWFGLRTCSQAFFILFILFTPHFLVFIYESMRITDSWAQSRDLSTDKQNRVYLCVSQSTWGDFSEKKKKFNHDVRNGNEFLFFGLLWISWSSYNLLWMSKSPLLSFSSYINGNMFKKLFCKSTFEWS